MTYAVARSLADIDPNRYVIVSKQDRSGAINRWIDTLSKPDMAILEVQAARGVMFTPQVAHDGTYVQLARRVRPWFGKKIKWRAF